MASSANEILPIPIPSRSATPTPSRPRSDTQWSASSASSSILQTPQTPPILGLLGWSPVSPVSPSPGVHASEVVGVRAKLSRSKSSFKDKTAKLKSGLLPSRSRTSLESTAILGPDEYFPSQPAPINHFDALPRELRLLVLRTLVLGWEDRGRWAGSPGGRRELIRLSRVSKGWQDLCLDGQLWSDVDLCAMAPHLHRNTLQRILDSTNTYARRLELRGMDKVDRLVHMPNLTHLDLRGCRRLLSSEICKVIGPALVHVNLKGVRGVSSEVLRRLADARHLEMLDVSRCRQIDLADMALFMRSSEAQIRDLRVAGLQAGRAGRQFTRLARVDRLDMLGCGLKDEDLDLTDTITHLILSSNPHLTSGVFSKLKLPNLVALELANLDIYRESIDPRHLVDFLRTTPRLQRLDLDGTGARGGVNDRVINALIRFCPDLAELHISHAVQVSSDALIRLIRTCKQLTVLEADNTPANNAVMREFVKRREGRINLQDCRGITPAAYSELAPATRPRQGWDGLEALPFGYEATEQQGLVLKTFWSWRRVGIPRAWREARSDLPERQSLRSPPRRSSFWRGEEAERERCVIM